MEPKHLRFSELFKLSLRTFKLKPIRALLTILGMSVGIGAVLFLVSLGYGLQYILIGKLVTTEDSLITMEASYPSESDLAIKKEVLTDVYKIPGVTEVSPIAEFPGEIRTGDYSGLVLTRIVEPSYFRLTGINPELGSVIVDGESAAVFTSQSLGLVNMGATSTNSIGKELGLKVFYQADDDPILDESDSKKPLVVKGIIVDEQQPPMAIVYGSVLNKQPDEFRKLLVKAESVEVVEFVRDQLISKGFIVSARIDLVNQAKKIMNIITGVLGVFGVTALIVSAIGMFNTMIVGFMERIYEVGILKSIGATDADVRNLFLLESSVMGFLGGAGGVLIGVGGGKLVNLILTVVAVKLGGKSFELFITPWWFVGGVMVLSIFIGLMSGFWPARRASGLSPKEAFIRRG